MVNRSNDGTNSSYYTVTLSVVLSLIISLTGGKIGETLFPTTFAVDSETTTKINKLENELVDLKAKISELRIIAENQTEFSKRSELRLRVVEKTLDLDKAERE